MRTRRVGLRQRIIPDKACCLPSRPFEEPAVGKCELGICPRCDSPLVEVSHLNGLKTVQTMTQALRIAYRVGAAHRPKRCSDAICRRPNGEGSRVSWPSAE